MRISAPTATLGRFGKFQQELRQFMRQRSAAQRTADAIAASIRAKEEAIQQNDNRKSDAS
jgi:hypothetical protein